MFDDGLVQPGVPGNVVVFRPRPLTHTQLCTTTSGWAENCLRRVSTWIPISTARSGRVNSAPWARASVAKRSMQPNFKPDTWWREPPQGPFKVSSAANYRRHTVMCCALASLALAPSSAGWQVKLSLQSPGVSSLCVEFLLQGMHDYAVRAF